MPARNLGENTAMFTGIITGVGRIVAVDALGSSSTHGKRLTIETPPPTWTTSASATASPSTVPA
jgi:hypothetical protein